MNKEWFDNVPVRWNTGCVKWDEDPSPDVIPLWVADMDFRTAPVIIDALRERVEHGVFGYTLVNDKYYDALCGWFAGRHNYHIDRKMVIPVPGVVPAISAIIKALVAPGRGVIVQTPVYNCFFSSIRNNDTILVEAPLKRIDFDDSTFSYQMDFDALEKAASREDTDLFLLCNPHNPAGRCWTREELLRVAKICRRNNVRVVSDEIHCELTAPGISYVPYGSVDSSALVCVSPSKAFNIAGLQIANIICPDESVLSKVDRAVNINEVCDVNAFGPVALRAAYSDDGALWLDELREYLWENYKMLVDKFRELLPKCPVSRLEATYLPWIDVSSLDISSEQLAEALLEEAHVRVNSGDMYGRGGYIRINIACSRHTLAEGLNRIIGFLSSRI